MAAHIFCNCMGVPRFSFIAAKPGEREHKLKTCKGPNLPSAVFACLLHSTPSSNPLYAPCLPSACHPLRYRPRWLCSLCCTCNQPRYVQLGALGGCICIGGLNLFNCNASTFAEQLSPTTPQPQTRVPATAQGETKHRPLPGHCWAVRTQSWSSTGHAAAAERRCGESPKE